jgi:hypothetical protein
MVNEWVKKNEVAIDSGLRAEIMEDFVAGIKKVCEENYIEFPEEKANVVEELSATVEELKGKISGLLEQNVALTKKVEETTKERLVNEACEGLTDTQASKLRKLAEGVSADTDEEYATRLKTLRESYTQPKAGSSEKKTLTEDKASETDDSNIVEVSPDMERVLSVLERRKPNFTK